MDRQYWEKIAPDYNDEIFDVLKNDRQGIIVSAIKKIASKEKTVMDIGCAIGKWLPVLSPRFKKVYAVDISRKNLAIAHKQYSRFTNVVYRQVNLSNPSAKLVRCDAAICVNAILTGSLKKRTVFFTNLKKCIRKNGQLVLVVPSLESAMLTSIIRQRWNPDKHVAGTDNRNTHWEYKNFLQGNVSIDNVPTKHYLREELQLLLMREGFSIEKFQKIEYDWTTEFLNPPRWLKQPLPWDWMVLANRKG